MAGLVAMAEGARRSHDTESVTYLSLYPNKAIDMPENRWHSGLTIETGRGTGPMKPGQPSGAQALPRCQILRGPQRLPEDGSFHAPRMANAELREARWL
jgi:hypothetical protein